MLEFQFKALNTKLDYARLTEQLQLQQEEEKEGRGQGRDIAVVRVVPRLGDEDTSPPPPFPLHTLSCAIVLPFSRMNSKSYSGIKVT